MICLVAFMQPVCLTKCRHRCPFPRGRREPGTNNTWCRQTQQPPRTAAPSRHVLPADTRSRSHKLAVVKMVDQNRMKQFGD
uniref:Uncharacterized protein n=1 Tax=Triticum urartu TaxID=4572 RepID=A0A8R7U1S2_TRIUA